MKSALTAAIIFVTGLTATSSASAQPATRPFHTCMAAEIQARLEAHQSLRLRAERVSLEGDTLRLTGRASVWFDDTSVQAEEIVINQSTKAVALTTVRRISIGARSRCAPPPSSMPRVEYR